MSKNDKVKIERAKRNAAPPSIAPSKQHLHTLIIDTRHLLSGVFNLRDQMPRSQKDESGICTLITKHADRALFLTTIISDYTSRNNREDLLGELNLTLKHLKELILTAFERGYIKNNSSVDHLATKIIDISDCAVSYARGLEDKKKPKK